MGGVGVLQKVSGEVGVAAGSWGGQGSRVRGRAWVWEFTGGSMYLGGWWGCRQVGVGEEHQLFLWAGRVWHVV